MRAQVYGKAYKGCISSLVSVLIHRWNCFHLQIRKGAQESSRLDETRHVLKDVLEKKEQLGNGK